MVSQRHTAKGSIGTKHLTLNVFNRGEKKDELGLVEHETGPVGLQRCRHHGVEKDLLNQHFVA